MSDGVVVRVGFPSLVKGDGVLEPAHYEYPVTMKLPGYPAEKTFSRRYSDFHQLRYQLRAKYWYCIVPPIPKKESVQGTLTKNLSHISGNEENKELAEYRRTFLARFLKRLLFHSTLGKDELIVESFPDDQLWRQRLRDPVTPPKYLATSFADGITAALFNARNTSTPEARQAAAVTYEQCIASDHGGDVDWSLAVSYVSQVGAGYRTLKDSVKKLAGRRKQTGSALRGFGEALAAITEGEEDANLAKAIVRFSEQTTKVSDTYDKHSIDETKIVNILSYHVGMCSATSETLHSAYIATQYVRQLGKNIMELEASLAKMPLADQESVQSKILQVKLDKQQMDAYMKGAVKVLQGEVSSFHKTTQADMKELLMEFNKVQGTAADAMKKDWDELRRTVGGLVTTTDHQL